MPYDMCIDLSFLLILVTRFALHVTGFEYSFEACSDGQWPPLQRTGMETCPYTSYPASRISHLFLC